MALDGSTYCGGDEGRELGLGYPDSRGKVLGNGVQEGVDQTGLATVHPLQAVQPDVGSAQFGPFYAVADPLQAGDDLSEHPAVVRLVGFQDESGGPDG